MTCPKCNETTSATIEEVAPSGDFQPTVYMVVCNACGAPLHFLQANGAYQLGNLVNQVERVADALGDLPDAVEKASRQPTGSH